MTGFQRGLQTETWSCLCIHEDLEMLHCIPSSLIDAVPAALSGPGVCCFRPDQQWTLPRLACEVPYRRACLPRTNPTIISRNFLLHASELAIDSVSLQLDLEP